MYSENFKVVAVSSNSNSFGLRQIVLVAKSGVAFKACASYMNLPKKDSTVNVPVLVKNEIVVGYDLAALGYELPERMDNCPAPVLAEIFPEKV